MSELIGKKIPLELDAGRLTKFFREEQGPISYLMFGITYNCQLKCKHCCVGHYENEPQRDLNTQEIKDVLDQLAKPMVVNFFGDRWTYLQLGGLYWIFWALVDQENSRIAEPVREVLPVKVATV